MSSSDDSIRSRAFSALCFAVEFLYGIAPMLAFPIAVYLVSDDVASRWGMWIGIGAFGPWLLRKPVEEVWKHITPIRNRVTLWENYVVQALTCLIGCFVGYLGLISLDPAMAATMAALATLLCLPVYVMHARLCVHLGAKVSTPLKDLEPAQRLAVVPTRYGLRRAIRNPIAVVVAGVVTSATLTLAMCCAMLVHGTFAWKAVAITSCGGTLTWIVATLPFILIGRFLLRGDGDSSIHTEYVMGGIAFLSLVVVLCSPSIAKSAISYWSFGGAYLIIVFSLVVGGWALRTLWVPPSPAPAFA